MEQQPGKASWHSAHISNPEAENWEGIYQVSRAVVVVYLLFSPILVRVGDFLNVKGVI